MLSSYTKNAIVLGLLSCVGPFAIDMYLPALPTIAADLHASTAATQMTLMSFFIAFGLCQLVYGPVSDMAGRKPPLYVGLILFVIGSIGCAFAPDVSWLIAFRFVQGIGAASVMVIPRAVIRDLHTGIEATKLMALVMLVISVSPILAPLGGSALIVTLGWRAVFGTAAVAAIVALVLTALALPETRPASERVEVSVRSVLGSFGYLMRHWNFLGLTFIGGFGMASFFTFLAGSSFVYIEHYGLTPTSFSLTISVNAIGFIGASQFAAQLGQRFGMGRVVIAAASAYALFTTTLLGLNLGGVDSLPVMMVLLFLGFAAMGLVIPATMVLALEEHGPIAGMASALGGTLQMVSGGVMIVIVSQVFDGTPRPMVAIIALCAIAALVLSIVTLRGSAITEPQPAE
ncbi:multidrug effflux MFS transporter [Bradyrhizobium sp. U87765 SZCCT0131]|uniref:multidrug effflux MFS transporter n=1 Tax=unclassified Bradyrhizobium TaxID=2631580 RepID=UPI001BAA3F8F|nr:MULTISPECIES: multidrug effflux MFS transporter [unclassified Bradyrhizobium]MBR1218081.1 multidrug effflux MFS transporter [Bradyrhizobium sp. U87765 SZCCT0131]MBR1260973.1 multidrug effflux MFS transporter [Bradyrhizobium sp. U87765 SZCCT0134]MBR1303579.1 multidrug effflux MFS transporter [Bradyrhizobium sp. U87765 SZCCT0110]MBR1319185.1 multidrug effflux MFS transporter [Bradyrhizobium sp. U87765 SZCCT0109]MBR1347510.1 multidrug effflux MFS transporter [Bradyrhizobium sp. U87765 SZCCT004